MSAIVVSLDESGDTGSKIGRGSSTFYVVGITVFSVEDSAIRAEECLQQLREELGRPNQEFRYTDNDTRTRRAFVAATASLPFTYHAAVLSKAVPQSLSGLALSIYSCAQALCLAAPNVGAEDQLTVLYDETTRERKVQRQFESDLRKSVNRQLGRDLVRKVTARDSRRSDLIQIADYVAGIVHRAERGNAEAIAYREQLRRRSGDLWRGRV